MVEEPRVPGDDSADDQERSERWQRMLTGSDPSLARLRRTWRLLPEGPRCKMCAAPFHGVGRVVTRVISHGQSEKNPLMCNLCFSQLRDYPGGADIELSVLFADVRGSTGLAERLGAATFRAHLQRMYRMAHQAVEAQDGLVDKFLGDGVMALFLPVLTGEDHPGRAIRAATDLIDAVETSELPAAGVRVGAGVHSGTAFVGVIGSDERLDFTALGDTVNVAARLGGIAGPAELLVSAIGWDHAARDVVPDERGPITVQGRSEPLEVVHLRPAASPTVAVA
jgi:adenylate cyclase